MVYHNSIDLLPVAPYCLPDIWYTMVQRNYMPPRYYTATKSRSQSRQSWSVSFRHPLRVDSAGKPGLKVRKGLGTNDEQQADRLVGELNELLGAEQYWTASARVEAARRFSPIVVEAFYAGLEPVAETGAGSRDEVIPLPGAEEGYARVLLVGSTAAGKTTLLRHLIGSHPQRDKFPSTSTGRTTVADIEVVTAGGPSFMGVVTFFPERAVRGYVQECVTATCLAARDGADDRVLSRHLLQHPDQRFRLNYVLGDWPTAGEDADDEWGFGKEADDESDDIDAADDPLPEGERRENAERLQDWIARIRALAEAQGAHVARDLDIAWESLAGEELDAVEAVLAGEVESSEEYSDLVLEILDQILLRFDRLGEGHLSRSTTGWPVAWVASSEDRDHFLRAMRWFSSNHAPRFGRLLTPLVQAMRVRGPFWPGLDGIRPRLVLIDGQGLGHTAASASSVTTNVTQRFGLVDVILLVDDAQHAMQAAPIAVIRSVVTGGYQDKLAIAFTHFDQVSGPNLPTAAARRDHVIDTVRNVLSSLRTELGATSVRSLEQELDARCFMLGWLKRASHTLSSKVRDQLSSLIRFFDASITPAEPIPTAPVYDPASLLFAVQAASRDFQALWSARLGLEAKDGIRKEHWTRIKALNRRIADGWDIEYDTLMPVADLFSRLSEEISQFLERPWQWEEVVSDDLERERAIASVRREVAAALHGFVMQRLIQQHISDWVRAYSHTGAGSTLTRVRDIRGIYEDAAPIPGVIVTEHTSAFLEQVRELVHEAIVRGGGKLASATFVH